MSDTRPNILFVMTDQQRFDTIAALGNDRIYTPNMDRLVRRGVSFTQAYTTCAICAPARYTIHTGCEPPRTRSFSNSIQPPAPGQAPTVEGRCGSYLPRVMCELGYRTFGIGKFHTHPWDEDLGYNMHLHSEEVYTSLDQRRRDAYVGWIVREHPEYAHVEGLMGERTDMYYVPQCSALPAELGVEWWAADRAVEQIQVDDRQPWFGFVSFIGPHPPCAPPVPFNRIYNPDLMPDPVIGDLAVDHMDEQIPFENHRMWADQITGHMARAIRARYYGEITYIDYCLGRILDTVERSTKADNTLICFFSDHGDHLGDHHAWQKQSFFESACHVPFLVSWPTRLPADIRREELVCLADLFGLATSAAGRPEFRDGHDILGILTGAVPPRDRVIGYFGLPGREIFKCMVRTGPWKYIFMANGGREQLFDVRSDPWELVNLADRRPEIAKELRQQVVQACRNPGAAESLEGDDLRVFPYRVRCPQRITQFDISSGVTGFPNHPSEVVQAFQREAGIVLPATGRAIS